MKTITAALLRAQGKFKPIEKNTTAFKYKYAPLEVCYDALKPALAEEGILAIHPSRVREDGITIQATVLFHPASGEQLISELPMRLDGGPQDHGSASTYYKRYTFLGVCGAQPIAEDDDGAKAQDGREVKKAQPRDPRSRIAPDGSRKKRGGNGSKPNAGSDAEPKGPVANVYAEFLKGAMNNDDLRSWWERNKEELRKLKESNIKSYDEVVSEFAKRKKEVSKEN
jgi:hypothetical protein